MGARRRPRACTWSCLAWASGTTRSKSSPSSRLLPLLAGVGGVITLLMIFYRILFPLKYPRSVVAATLNLRTILGKQVYNEPEHQVHPDDEDANYVTPMSRLL